MADPKAGNSANCAQFSLQHQNKLLEVHVENDDPIDEELGDWNTKPLSLNSRKV